MVADFLWEAFKILALCWAISVVLAMILNNLYMFLEEVKSRKRGK